MADTLSEIHRVQAEAMMDAAIESIEYFKKSIHASGQVLTSELLNSFTTELHRTEETLGVELGFMTYGRFKDMKYLEWKSQMPNVVAIERWIEERGRNNFYNFKDLRPPETTVQVEKTAFVIARNMKKNMQRRKRSWYNKTKMDYINKSFHAVVDATLKNTNLLIKTELES